MRKQLVLTVVAAMSVAGLLQGQQWLPPSKNCGVSRSHFLVNGAAQYLEVAATKPAMRESQLRSAEKNLTQAVTTGGQDKNPSAWYYFGRYYAMRGDLWGADSAFSKAEAQLPSCHDDIQYYRRNLLWVPAIQAGQAALQAQNYDSALSALRAAAKVFDGEPQAFVTLATVFFNIPPASFIPESTFRKQNPGLADSAFSTRYQAALLTHYDSAAKYFRLGVQSAKDPKFEGERKDAMFNLANSFYGALRYDSAAAAYDAYLKVAPNDVQARARLADVLSMGGHKDSAMTMYASILQHADSADPTVLFNAGVMVYNAAPASPDTAKISATCRRKPLAAGQTALRRRTACDREAADSQAQRDSAASGNYRIAAQAFEAGLVREPQNRDGLFNLTSSYFALHQGDKMLGTAQRLVQVDPMNRNSVRMLAQAWQLKSRGDSALYYVTISDSLLPVDVSVGSFGPSDQSASISGVVTNYHAKASVPLKLVFEFLNKTGTVVTTATSDIPAIGGNGTYAFQVQASGAGIVGWRYKKG